MIEGAVAAIDGTFAVEGFRQKCAPKPLSNSERQCVLLTPYCLKAQRLT